MLAASLWSRVRQKVETLGLVGTLAKASHKVVGRPRVLRVRSALVPFPVLLRFGTTDFPLYDAVFGTVEMCRFGLPSSAHVIVDAGANIGLTSVYYAAHFPEARIFAVEPEAGNFVSGLLEESTSSSATLN